MDFLPKEIRNSCCFYMGGIAAEDIYDQMRGFTIPLRCDKELNHCKILLHSTPYSSLDIEVAVKHFLYPLFGILTIKWNAIETLSNHIVTKYFDNVEYISGTQAEKIIEALKIKPISLESYQRLFEVKTGFPNTVPVFYSLWYSEDDSFVSRDQQ